MSFLKETSLIDGAMQPDRPEGVDAPKLNESDIPKFDQRDVPHWILDDKTGNHSVTELSDIFDAAFKSFGLTSESNEVSLEKSPSSLNLSAIRMNSLRHSCVQLKPRLISLRCLKSGL